MNQKYCILYFIEPPAPPTDDFEVQNNNKAIDDTTVDLDTRIAMLFSTRDDAPSLFGLDDDSADETKKAVKCEENESKSSETAELNSKLKSQLKINEESESRHNNNDVDMEEGELKDSESLASSVPSAFESKETFKNNRKYLKTRRRRRSKEKKVEKVESGASDISSSEDELLAKGSYSPPPPVKNSKIKAIKAEDEMSLSSLSSTEPIKEEAEVASEFKNFDASAYMYQHMGGAYQNYYYQFQQPNVQQQWSYDAAYGWSAYKSELTTNDDPHEAAVKKVIEKLIEELKQILKKDINKRMIENTAFKKYEAWWDEQERNKNTRIIPESEKVPSAPSIPLTSLPLAVLDPMSDSYQTPNKGGGLGMLRNIRIQRIKREPIPVQIEEDSRKSDEDDMVHGSDSEKEDIRTKPSSSFLPKRKISDSSSSDSSDSDITSSEDNDSDDEKDHVYSSDTASLISNEELSSSKKYTKKDSKNIFSDTESDDDEIKELSKVSAKTKDPIYSESEEDEVIDSKVDNMREKTPSGKNTPVHPTESDSDFFNDDVISKPPRTPGRSSSDDQNEKSKPVKEQKEEKVKIKTPPKEDRMYSDSDEEREYQERIRRNTEWMEQIEREAKEEAEKQKLLKAQQPIKDEVITSTVTSRAPSPINIERTTKYDFKDEPITPLTTSFPPTTPGAEFSMKNMQQDLLDASGKKKRGRPKGSTGKIKEKEPKKVKNGAISKAVEFVQPQNIKPELEQQKYSLKLSPSSTSSDGGSSQASLVAIEHCYSLPPSASPSTSSSSPTNQEAVRHLDHDHGYYGKSDVTPLQSIQPAQLEEQVKSTNARPVGRPRKDPNAPKAQYTKKSDKLAAAAEKHQQQQHQEQIKATKAQEKIKKIDPIQHQQMVENFVPSSRYNKRAHNEEFDVLCKFLTEGIDQEDVDYMKRAYTCLIQNDIPGTELLHQVHWVDHCATDRAFDPVVVVPKKRRRGVDDTPELRKHVTGCARSEGFYKVDSREKAHYKYHHLKGTAAGSHLVDTAKVAKMQNASREARSNQRRLLTAFGGATESDLLKFNQLKFRKKQLKFAKSAIHDWGLFAMEPIAADEMVIEYVGQMVRPSIADLRESKYEAIGIGSSYLFRIDLETIIDATKCGNLARFINHSCNVSCFKFI